jgi:L-lysine 2,3-aminomutase
LTGEKSIKGNSSAAEISRRRALVLKRKASAYQKKKAEIKTGFDLQEVFQATKKKILALFQATEADWNDWHWQISHRISDIDTLAKIINLDEKQKAEIEKVGQKYRWAISPYFLSLIVPANPKDPVMLQSLPSAAELNDEGETDPMAESHTSPAPCITRRYPDRLIINVTNQ